MSDFEQERIEEQLPLSPTDFHLMLVLSEGETYGYALMKAMAAESDGVIAPEIGSLYRMLARLTASGLVAEAGDRAPGAGETPGKPRRYYRITPLGGAVLEAESVRLRSLLLRADDRTLAATSGDS